MDDPLPKSCRNCGAPLADVFCGACGQTHRYARLRLRSVLEDSFEGVASFDSRILRTIWGLTVRPAELITAYLSGKRISYMHPLKYALVMCALWLFVRHQLAGAARGPAELNSVSRELVALQHAYTQPMHFAVMPLMVGLLWLAFRRLGLTYLEHFVALLYAYGHAFFLLTLLLGFVKVFDFSGGETGAMAIMGGYLGLSLGSFYGGNLLGAGLRVAGAWLAMVVLITQLLRLGVYLFLTGPLLAG